MIRTLALAIAASVLWHSSALAHEESDIERCEQAIEEGIHEERQFAKEIVVFTDSNHCRVKVIFANHDDWSKFGRTRAKRGVNAEHLKAPWGNPIKLIAEVE